MLAYRANMRVTRHNEPAWHAAYAAFREVLPEMPEQQAKMETTHAIAYAAANHTKWFWGGVYGKHSEPPVVRRLASFVETCKRTS